MKKFVNDPAKFVPEFMKGIALANPDLLDFNAEFQMITRKSGPDNAKVSVVQGSGSGHEPAHVMAVGPGMLTGACQGAVFAAPAVDSCYETIKACASDAGVLVLVNNYQGDRMAWDMATEMATAEGINATPVLDQRRRRGRGQPLHRRPPRRGRQLLRHQGLRRRRRAGQEPRRGLCDRRPGQQERPHDGRRADQLHPAGQGHADLRPRRRRDRSRRRHPRRAGPPPREDQERRRDHQGAVRGGRAATSRSTPATAWRSWSTASAAPRSPSST